MDNSRIFHHSLSWDDRKRNYFVYSPSKLDGNSPAAVVIMFHGGGSSAQKTLEKYDWKNKADAEGFLVVFPDGAVVYPSKPASFRHNPQVWNDGFPLGPIGEHKVDDIGFINAMLDEIIPRYNIDQKRIFASGFSNGASMAFHLGARLSRRIAAIAPVSGHLWLKEIKLERPVPMVYFFGADDPLNPLEGGYVGLPWNVNMLKPPVQDSVERWARLNGCNITPEVLFDRNGVRAVVYKPAKAGGEVIYYQIQGQGHIWPGGVAELPHSLVGAATDKLNAEDVIWDFFKKHPMK